MRVMPGMRVSVEPTDEGAEPDGRRLTGKATARPGLSAHPGREGAALVKPQLAARLARAGPAGVRLHPVSPVRRGADRVVGMDRAEQHADVDGGGAAQPERCRGQHGGEPGTQETREPGLPPPGWPATTRSRMISAWSRGSDEIKARVARGHARSTPTSALSAAVSR